MVAPVTIAAFAESLRKARIIAPSCAPRCVFGCKSVELAGCSSGGFGTVRAKLALLPVLHTNNMLGELLEALAAWARRFGE